MIRLIRFFKSLFGFYDTGIEYWVPIRSIRINPEFRKHDVKPKKMQKKMEYYLINGSFREEILIRRDDWILLDGYTSFRIAEIEGMTKVPVKFVE